MVILATIFAIVGCATISYGILLVVEEMDKKMHEEFIKGHATASQNTEKVYGKKSA